jgi:hypothetical protein
MADLLGWVCYELAQQHGGCATAASSASASNSLLQAVAWEALAVLPATAAVASETLPALHSAHDQAAAALQAADQHCMAMGRMLAAVETAGPLVFSSPKQLAVWAAATNAALRLLPTLLGQGSREKATKLAEYLIAVLWLDLSEPAQEWAMTALLSADDDGRACMTAQSSSTAKAWAAAAASLFAAHSRACRLVHWLKAQPASLLHRLLPTVQDGLRWRIVRDRLCCHFQLCLVAIAAVKPGNNRCVLHSQRSVLRERW